jgi:hypothetical protein
MPVVPFSVVPVIVFAVAIVPKPEAIDPLARAPTDVSDEVTIDEPSVVPESTVVPLSWMAEVALRVAPVPVPSMLKLALVCWLVPFWM